MFFNQKKKKKIFRALSKPLRGNNRSFSQRATKRKFATNKQNFCLGGEKYRLPVKLFRSYWINQEQFL